MGQIQERFALFIEKNPLPKSEIDKRLGIANGYTGKIVTGKASFGVDILERIITAFPELNPLWLVTGKGEMLLNQTQVVDEQTPKESLEDVVEKILNRKLDELLQKRGVLA